MSDFRQRLEQFLTARRQFSEVSQLTPDASTREYFRIRWTDLSAIACVYPESFAFGDQSYLDVTNLFLVSGLPVARIYDFDEKFGVIILEDFGDRILRPVLDDSTIENRQNLLNQAISLIAQIQAATAKAFEIDSIASRLKFDVEKLVWELEFFKTHYFQTYKKQPLSAAESNALGKEFNELAAELESMASVLCHRDFHSFNLMIGENQNLKIIDHQDARIGTTSYDLASLLLDRLLEAPDPDSILEKQKFLLDERIKIGLPAIDLQCFAYEFQLQSVQRCLKAVGTFSFQSENRGKTYFIQYVKPTLQIVLKAAEELNRFPVIQDVIRRELNS